MPWKWEERELGKSDTQTEIAQDWGLPNVPVKPIHKSVLPPGGHIRALSHALERRPMCMSLPAGALWSSRETRREARIYNHQIGHWNV